MGSYPHIPQARSPPPRTLPPLPPPDLDKEGRVDNQRDTPRNTRLTVQPIRATSLGALRGYLFTWDDLDKQIGVLSGGERNRLQIAAAVQRQANFLILDEPTNHMDIPSCEAIEDALLEFTGTVLLVSHDRYLLDSVATAVVEVRGQVLHRFVGGFSEYWAERKRRRPVAAAADGGRRQVPEPSLEARIERLESEKVELERQVTRALQSGDRTLERRYAARLRRVVRQVERLYEQWAGN